MQNWAIVCVLEVVFAVGVMAQKSGDPASGKDLFHQCSGCHNTDTDVVKAGPSLKRLFKHPKLKNGKALTDATVRDIISAGGNGMPPFADDLSDQDKNDLIAYLKTL